MKHLILLTLTVSAWLIGCQRKYYDFDPDWVYAHRCTGGCIDPSPKLTYYDKLNKKKHIYCLKTMSVQPTWADSSNFRIKAYTTNLLNPEPGKETSHQSIPSFYTTNNFSSDSIIYSYAHEPVFRTLQPLINLSQKEGMRTYSGDGSAETLRKGYDPFGIMTYEFSYFYKDVLSAKYTYNNAAGFISIKSYDADGALVRDEVLRKIDELTLEEYLRQSSPSSLLLFGCP